MLRSPASLPLRCRRPTPAVGRVPSLKLRMPKNRSCRHSACTVHWEAIDGQEGDSKENGGKKEGGET